MLSALSSSLISTTRMLKVSQHSETAQRCQTVILSKISHRSFENRSKITQHEGLQAATNMKTGTQVNLHECGMNMLYKTSTSYAHYLIRKLINVVLLKTHTTEYSRTREIDNLWRSASSSCFPVDSIRQHFLWQNDTFNEFTAPYETINAVMTSCFVGGVSDVLLIVPCLAQPLGWWKISQPSEKVQRNQQQIYKSVKSTQLKRLHKDSHVEIPQMILKVV